MTTVFGIALQSRWHGDALGAWSVELQPHLVAIVDIHPDAKVWRLRVGAAGEHPDPDLAPAVDVALGHGRVLQILEEAEHVLASAGLLAPHDQTQG